MEIGFSISPWAVSMTKASTRKKIYDKPSVTYGQGRNSRKDRKKYFLSQQKAAISAITRIASNQSDFWVSTSFIATKPLTKKAAIGRNVAISVVQIARNSKLAASITPLRQTGHDKAL